jgi:hypothetical protein
VVNRRYGVHRRPRPSSAADAAPIRPASSELLDDCLGGLARSVFGADIQRCHDAQKVFPFIREATHRRSSVLVIDARHKPGWRWNVVILQAELAAGRQDRLVYYAFDLLWRDGDLRKLPQLERKQLLADLLGENDIDMP